MSYGETAMTEMIEPRPDRPIKYKYGLKILLIFVKQSLYSLVEYLSHQIGLFDKQG